MLIEMKSPAFKKQGEGRPPIHFKEGLNVVLGKEDGAMSIGKSSSLLAIDFVFGGDTYIKSDGVKKEGHHTIFFAFEFTERSSILPEIRATVTLFLFVIRITN
ncbi:MAG: hypothetical protein V8S82_01165 [Eubacteriales bacterium]